MPSSRFLTKALALIVSATAACAQDAMMAMYGTPMDIAAPTTLMFNDGLVINWMDTAPTTLMVMEQNPPSAMAPASMAFISPSSYVMSSTNAMPANPPTVNFNFGALPTGADPATINVVKLAAGQWMAPDPATGINGEYAIMISTNGMSPADIQALNMAAMETGGGIMAAGAVGGDPATADPMAAGEMMTANGAAGTGGATMMPMPGMTATVMPVPGTMGGGMMKTSAGGMGMNGMGGMMMPTTMAAGNAAATMGIKNAAGRVGAGCGASVVAVAAAVMLSILA
ncbi:hypothetical protein HK101_011493 [Irineochytrium annulatum]|nr:hypothetical protein HK101_011493 [Irineochytrium annulatum]